MAISISQTTKTKSTVSKKIRKAGMLRLNRRYEIFRTYEFFCSLHTRYSPRTWLFLCKNNAYFLYNKGIRIFILLFFVMPKLIIFLTTKYYPSNYRQNCLILVFLCPVRFYQTHTQPKNQVRHTFERYHHFDHG